MEKWNGRPPYALRAAAAFARKRIIEGDARWKAMMGAHFINK